MRAEANPCISKPATDPSTITLAHTAHTAHTAITDPGTTPHSTPAHSRPDHGDMLRAWWMHL
jgi:hypothetical protein